MKQSFVLSLLLLVAGTLSGWACVHEAPTYNYYMMDVCPKDGEATDFSTRFNAFWQQYCGGETWSYSWDTDTIRAIATQRGDHELLHYMDWLDRYLEISRQLGDTWDYPTREQLDERQQTLQQMLQQSQRYRGRRLRPQWLLLGMRARMVMGQDEENIRFWQRQGQQLPASAYRDMMRNIYAGALLHTGQRRAACDIYVEQGDWTSISWALRKHRSLAGIRSVYTEHPTSPSLWWLVGDFVNNVQEVVDATTEIGYLPEIGRRSVTLTDAEQFVGFAREVLAEGKTDVPCLWQTAIGMIHLLTGRTAEAYDELTQAIRMQGTEAMVRCARCCRLLAIAAYAEAPQREAALAEGFGWLDTQQDEDDYIDRVRQRIVYTVLVPQALGAGHPHLATSLLSMMHERQDHIRQQRSNGAYLNGEYACNGDYAGWSDWVSRLDSLSADELRSYAGYLSREPDSVWERYVWQHTYREPQYYNDRIGTRLLAEGRFDEAIPYLQQVSIDFLRLQNIAYYAAKRSYTEPRWMGHQATPSAELDLCDSPYAGLQTHPKLAFCQEMAQLLASYQLTTDGEARRQQAYQLAVRYIQASSVGDCWWLSAYGWGSGEDVPAGEDLFVDRALQLLSESAQSDDFNLRQQSLYALAWIPQGVWCKYDWEQGGDVVNTDSRQFAALSRLDAFALHNPLRTASYVTRCDVLKRFRQSYGAR